MNTTIDIKKYHEVNPLFGVTLKAQELISARDMVIVQTLAQHGLIMKLTGSSRWGEDRPGDFDIMAYGFLGDNIKESINNSASEVAKLQSKIQNKNGSLGSVCFVESKINLILLSEKDFEIWAIATNMMACLPRIINKTMRYAAFEILRGVVKMVGV